MEIRCKKTDCTFNTGCSCNANYVEVEKNTCCGSYRCDEIKQGLIIENGNIFEVAEELVAKNLKNVPLACQAKNCLYNKAEKCFANGITVIDDSDTEQSDALCATFIGK